MREINFVPGSTVCIFDSTGRPNHTYACVFFRNTRIRVANGGRDIHFTSLSRRLQRQKKQFFLSMSTCVQDMGTFDRTVEILNTSGWFLTGTSSRWLLITRDTIDTR